MYKKYRLNSLNLIAAVFVLLYSGTIVHAAKSSNISVEGNINVKTKEILSAIKKDPGVSEDGYKENISNLMNLGYFEDVSVELDSSTNRTKYTVREKPYIKDILFEGNRAFTSSRLKGKIDLKKKTFYDEFKANEDKNKLEEYYKSKGFAFIKVTHSAGIDKILNTIILTYDIQEGKKITVKSIEFPGADKVVAKALLKQFKTKPKKTYQQQVLSEDFQKLDEYYKNNGFEDVIISSPIVSYEDKSEGLLAYIVINIDEGPKYTVREVSFSGNKIYGTNELNKAIKIKENTIYSKDKIAETTQSISELYAEKGYIQVNITPVFKKYESSGKMDIHIEIEENDMVYVGRIYIDGLTYTKEYVVRRELMIKEDDPIIASKVRRSMEKISNLGFLEDINMNIQGTNVPGKADLIFSMAEGKPGMVSAGFGYSSTDGMVGTLQLSHMNLFGRGQKLNLSWEKGSTKNNYQLSWTESWFMGKPVSLGLSLYDLTRTYSYTTSTATYSSGYDEHRRGISINVGPRISTDFLSLLFTYSYEFSDILNIDPAIDPGLFPAETQFTSSLLGRLSYDTRDNIFDTTRGSLNSFSLQYAGGPILGGTVSYYKPSLKTGLFIPTFWKFVLSASANISYIEPLYGYNITLNDRFLLGGPDTIRGYSYKSIGPTETGGNAMLSCNIEYKFPIAQERGRTILQGAIFYDFGGTWANMSDVKFEIGATDNWITGGTWDNLMKSSWGWGIRIGTPVFPIRLDWGYPLQPAKGKTSPFEFWFTIGQVF